MPTLKEQVREAARLAEAANMGDDFNAMSWLDLTLEDNPEVFDDLFQKGWNELSEDEQYQRARTIRSVL